jgi:hypothetical protein
MLHSKQLFISHYILHRPPMQTQGIDPLLVAALWPPERVLMGLRTSKAVRDALLNVSFCARTPANASDTD